MCPQLYSAPHNLARELANPIEVSTLTTLMCPFGWAATVSEAASNSPNPLLFSAISSIAALSLGVRRL